MKPLAFANRALAPGLVLLVPLVVAAGCGTSDRPGVITVRTVEPPALVAFRDEASPAWQTLPTAGARVFEIAPTGSYRVAVICEPSSYNEFVSVTEHARTLDDDSSFDSECIPTAYPFQVTGRMVQPGQISLGDFDNAVPEPNWEFSLPTTGGELELVMLAGSLTDGFERVAIRRDIPVNGNIALGEFDLTKSNPQELVPIQFTPTNLRDGEQLTESAHLDTGSTFATLHLSVTQSEPWTFRLAPNSALAPTDHHFVRMSANESAGAQSRSRNVRRHFRVGDSTAVTLLEPLGAVAFQATPRNVTATWSTLPMYDELRVSRESFGSATVFLFTVHELVLSRSFVETTGATSAVLDVSDIPGFKSEWDVDASGDHWVGLAATKHTGRDTASSSISEALSPTAARTAREPRGAKQMSHWMADRSF